jgi:hypothetical protein
MERLPLWSKPEKLNESKCFPLFTSPNNGHCATQSACRLRADFVAEIGIPTARDGWCIF